MMNKKIISLIEIAELAKSEIVGNPDHEIDDISDLESATERHVSFLSNPRYLQAMKKSRAGAIIIDKKATQFEGRNYLISDNPSQAFQKLIDYFHPPRKHPSGFFGIHPTAVIHPLTEIGTGVCVGPQAVIDEGVKIGENTFIGAGTYIGPESTIGNECVIHPRVVIRENSVIGNRVIIQPGAVIGSCGFGYITEQGKHVKLNQVGYVAVEDDVEIGANTTIDRARFQCTRIGKGSKIDNLVQLGHAVKIGEHNIIVAQTCIAGSSTTGEYVVIGGQVAIAGHLDIGTGVSITGKSGVTKSLFTGKYGGTPAIPLQDYNRNQVFLKNIEKFVNALKNLENRVNQLNSKKER